jgi:hypothetical protein
MQVGVGDWRLKIADWRWAVAVQQQLTVDGRALSPNPDWLKKKQAFQRPLDLPPTGEAPLWRYGCVGCDGRDDAFE